MMNNRDQQSAGAPSAAEQAAYWFVRRDGRDLVGDEAAAFAHWLAASSGNKAAYERVASTWRLLDGGEGSEELRPLRERANRVSAKPRRRQVVAGSLVAAAIMIGVMIGGPSVQAPESTEGQARPTLAAAAVRYATGKGELRVVVLADGSKVTLNTGSEIFVEIGSARRAVRLASGQALFEVAHDARRPFVVSAAGRDVTALGTVFEVRVEPSRMEVVLVTGKVAVDDKASAAKVRSILKPGEALVLGAGATRHPEPVDVNAKLRWREGFVEFADEPLGHAIAEINRYSDRLLVLDDKGLATERVSGVFRTGDPDRFIAIVGELLPVEARAVDGKILISRRAD